MAGTESDPHGSVPPAFWQWSEEAQDMVENELYRVEETLLLDRDAGGGYMTTIQACVKGQTMSEYDLRVFEGEWGRRPKVTALAAPQEPRGVKAPESIQSKVEVETSSVEELVESMPPPKVERKAPAKRAPAKRKGTTKG